MKLYERGKPIASFQLLPIKLDLQCCFSNHDFAFVLPAFLVSPTGTRASDYKYVRRAFVAEGNDVRTLQKRGARYLVSDITAS